jgi:transcriptional regulator with XRE-family HTH domain
VPDAETMRSLRLRRELLLREVAERMGVSVTYISDLERGARKWTYELGERFLKALDGGK